MQQKPLNPVICAHCGIEYTLTDEDRAEVKRIAKLLHYTQEQAVNDFMRRFGWGTGGHTNRIEAYSEKTLRPYWNKQLGYRPRACPTCAALGRNRGRNITDPEAKYRIAIQHCIADWRGGRTKIYFTTGDWRVITYDTGAEFAYTESSNIVPVHPSEYTAVSFPPRSAKFSEPWPLQVLNYSPAVDELLAKYGFTIESNRPEGHLRILTVSI